jgi:hypothetical protein
MALDEERAGDAGGTVDDPPVPDPGPRVRSTRPSPAAAWAARAWSDNNRALLVAAVGTVVLRVVTEWVGLVAQYGVGFPHVVARRPSVLAQVWSHWDAGFYLSIARYGYAGRVPGPGQAAHGIAFAPLYPVGVRLVHEVTSLGWATSAELLSAAALFVGLTALHRLAASFGDDDLGSASVLLLLAFPTAFFLLAPYPESLALALVAVGLLCARRGRWLAAGLCAAGASLTKYYLVILAVTLCAMVVAAWLRDPRRSDDGRRVAPPWTRLAEVAGPTAAVLVAWLAYLQIRLGDASAITRAQSEQWHRHLGAPWTLAWRTGSDLVHWRFLDTSTASVNELLDAVTVLLLAGATVYAWRRLSRSTGLLLGLGLAVMTFETVLLSVTREALVFAPLFVAFGSWTVRRRWLERLLLALWIPCGYFLVQRYVTGAFAG